MRASTGFYKWIIWEKIIVKNVYCQEDKQNPTWMSFSMMLFPTITYSLFLIQYFSYPCRWNQSFISFQDPLPLSAIKWTRIGLLYLMIRIDYVMDTTVTSKHRRWKKSRLTRNANPIIQTNHEQKSTPLARHLGKLIIKQPICRFLWYYIRSSPPCDRISSCLSMQAYWMINSKTIPNCSHKK